MIRCGYGRRLVHGKQFAQLSERGLNFSFQKATCTVEQRDGTIAARGVREGGAYRLLTKRLTAEQQQKHER